MAVMNVGCLAEGKPLDVNLICKKRKGERNKLLVTGVVKNNHQQKYLIDGKTGKSFGGGTQVTGVFLSEKTKIIS